MTHSEDTSGFSILNALEAKNASDKRARIATQELGRQVREGHLSADALAGRDILLPLDLLNVLPDNGDGQINTLAISEHPIGLKVTVSEWATMEPGEWVIAFRIDEDTFDYFHPVEVGFGTLDATIPLNDHRYTQGQHTLSYRAQWTDDGNIWHGEPAIFYVDITDPNSNREPDAPLLPDDLENGLITPEYLAEHGGVTFTLPTPSDHKPDDTYSFLIDAEEVVTDELLVAPFTVTLPAETFDRLAPGTHEIQYSLTDRAGNRSDMSVPESVILIKTPAPVLAAPIIPEGGNISLAEARDGVPVWHNYNTPGVDDIITFTWVGVRQDSYFFPTEYATVPFADILAPGRIYSGEVIYEVNRHGAVYTSPPTQVDVDLEHVGPENPDEPDSVNPLLDPLSLLSSTGNVNSIDAGDKGQDATITVPLYDDAVVGEMIQVFYGDGESPVAAPIALDANDIAANEIEVTLLWALIQDKGNGIIHSFYRIFPAGKPENYQQSPNADITVSVNNIDDLPVAEFPGKNPDFDVINCDSEPWIKGVDVLMAYPTFQEGDVLTLNWVLDTTFPPQGGPVPTTPEETTRREFVHSVTLTEATQGKVVFNVPWGEHLWALDRGAIVVYWHLARTGDVSGTSELNYVRYSRRGAGQVCPPED